MYGLCFIFHAENDVNKNNIFTKKCHGIDDCESEKFTELFSDI